MITEDHAAFAFLGVARSDEKVIGDLNFRRPQRFRDFAKRRPAEDVAALYADDLAWPKFSDCKESTAVNRAALDCGLWREIRECFGSGGDHRSQSIKTNIDILHGPLTGRREQAGAAGTAPAGIMETVGGK